MKLVQQLTLLTLVAGVLTSIGQFASSQTAETSSAGTEIRLHAPRVFRGTDTRLSIELNSSLVHAVDRIRWSVTAGKLLSDDRSAVVWVAPEHGDAATVQAELFTNAVKSGAKGTSGGERSLGVIERKFSLALPSTAAMVRIPGGEFTIGDTWTDTSAESYIKTNQNKADKPAHRVRVSPYFIDRDRVTNAQFVAFLIEAKKLGLVEEINEHAVLGWHNGTLLPYYRFSYGDLDDPDNAPDLRGAIEWDGTKLSIQARQERHPVVDVTWAGADAYARFFGRQLPTNAQWEYAARGDDGRRYPWGNELPTPLHANVNGYHGNRLFPVGTFSPTGDSPFGVHDMLGAIFEWVHDWYNESYYEDIAGDGVIVDPKGPHWGKDRVLRGVPYTQGLTGDINEQPPLCFRYAWFFEFPLGAGIAKGDTGFRTAAVDWKWRDAQAALEQARQGKQVKQGRQGRQAEQGLTPEASTDK